MKTLTRHLPALLLCLAVLLAAVPAALAAEYTYTVTLSAGKQGSLTNSGVTVEGSDYQLTGDGTTLKLSGLHKGAQVTFRAQDAAVLADDSKYYVSGIRLSGRDNNTRSADPSFVVDGDADYVVAYGIRGDMVQYTVQYQDEDGNALADSRTYYGNVGDEAVVAYLYIEGYRPLDFNLAKVLTTNSAENVFTFVYTQILDDEVVIVDGGTTVLPGSNTVTDRGTTTEDGEDESDTEEEPEEVIIEEVQPAQPADNSNANAGDGSGDALNEEDIGDNQTPLGRLVQQIKDAVEQITGGSPAGTAALIVGVAIILAALLFLIFFLLRRRREDKDDETNAKGKHTHGKP